MISLDSRRLAVSLFCASSIFGLDACTHDIHVAPTAPAATAVVHQTLHVEVPLLALQGPDRMPGIALLQWPAADLREAVAEYARQRGTFLLAGADDQHSLTLVVRAWLWMRSREVYRYIIHFDSDIGPTGKPPVKSYVVQKETAGSDIRWLTSSDERPIAAAVQAALDDLFTQIEADAALYGRR